MSRPKIVIVKKLYISNPAIIKRYDFDVSGGSTINNTLAMTPNQAGGPMQVPVQYEGGQLYPQIMMSGSPGGFRPQPSPRSFEEGQPMMLMQGVARATDQR